MIAKTIKYTDYNGVEREETYYFNLSKVELMEMNLDLDENGFEHILETENNAELFKIFRDLILKSYGEKSKDGKSFVKSPEATKAFEQTIAYEEIFMLLASNAEVAAEFFNGVIPKIDIPVA